MKTVVLDDDPTGTQSATGVWVLLRWDTDLLLRTLREHDAVYLQTNSRALNENAAVELAHRIREQILEAEDELGVSVQVVLRGDSTLRGHVFSETDVFTQIGPEGEQAPVLFVPAFPAGGRTTLGGVHLVEVDGVPVPAHDTEYAQDPVFPFASANMVNYARDKGSRLAVSIPVEDVRESGGMAVTRALAAAKPPSVVVPDAVTEADIELIHRGLQFARSRGVRAVVRTASPLAARLADCASEGLLAEPFPSRPSTALFVCGSHTRGAAAQLQALASHLGIETVTVSTAAALEDPIKAGTEAASALRNVLGDSRVAILASERDRRPEDNTLAHGEKVMQALTTAVSTLVNDISVVIAKGGITSADVASKGLSSNRAMVRGQVLPGVSIWHLETPQGEIPYVIVPGNVGGPNTLVDIAKVLN